MVNIIKLYCWQIANASKWKGGTKTPLTKWWLEIKFFVFGNEAFVHIDKNVQKKLYPKKLQCLLIGCDEKSETYRCIILRWKI